MKINSLHVDSYKERPEMAADKITDKVIKYMDEFDFVCVNFANPDMVGHTGDLKATMQAVGIVDNCTKKIIDKIIRCDGQALIIADHGNAEEMINLKTGEMMTEHTTNPVPCTLIRKDTKGIKLKTGRLADVAPTLLKMMGLKKTKKMTGKALF